MTPYFTGPPGRGIPGVRGIPGRRGELSCQKTAA